MGTQTTLSDDIKKQICCEYKRLLSLTTSIRQPKDTFIIKEFIRSNSANYEAKKSNTIGINPIIHTLQTSCIVANEIGLGRTSIITSVLYEPICKSNIPLKTISDVFGESAASICEGLVKVNELYERQLSVNNDNYRKLLFTLAKDVRVILIIIAERLNIMRHMKAFDVDSQKKISSEVSFLYAPLAHRLGLYSIKSEMEDLAMKYTNREMYDTIARKLNETKKNREKYIENFIKPIRTSLDKANIKYEIKGRTKSISSIYNKLVKQNVDINGVYDLFAIRIIIDCDISIEKSECWRIYSIVTDMYKPNPARLKDWISVPKSNGYESLHITVFGPQQRWVEVQIRTKRMDEMAEKGFAAHWKYKGIKAEHDMEQWLSNIRDILDSPELNNFDFIDDFKLNLYDKEVFAFTPKGELRRLAKGATVLDFAFNIHTNVGCQCTGAIVNNKNVSLRYVLQNGDTVSVLTSQHQEPKQDWINYVATSKAKAKLRQALREKEFRQAEIGKETLDRRLKNWKMEIDDSILRLLMKEFGYKDINVFYSAIGEEKITAVEIKSELEKIEAKEKTLSEQTKSHSIVEYTTPNSNRVEQSKQSVLVLEKGLTNIEYTLAHCCNPIYGDPVFAFISATGGVKVHRIGCHNEPEMRRRFGYRIIDARWNGTEGEALPVMLHVSGNDSIGIMSNISQLFAKETASKIRNINVDSTEGGFDGTITILVSNVNSLNSIIKKISQIKGIRKIDRIYTH